MSVLLNRAYAGFVAGTIAEFSSELEAALIAQGIATTNAGPATSGAQSNSVYQGQAVIPIGASSVVITNPNIDANSKVWAVVSQAAADGTLLRVERVVPAAGSVTIYGTANATAATVIDWAIIVPSGMTPKL